MFKRAAGNEKNTIDFLFLIHAHIDHIGRVPDLIDAGFCGEIICTYGTKALKSIANHILKAYYC
ncbi:hypothetical protein [Desulfobacter latus]|uniref:hypothetical protein n=1 Tax=Desulfobacter latus TaxID=2292 RepID=UPI003CCDBDD9